jgi:predicted polyphosphate/ATP-dependent NAD kinase
VKVGFIVNPIAGMGGAVGLKGTDGEQILMEAHARRAQKVSPARAREALAAIQRKRLSVDFLACSGEMGGDELIESGMEFETVFRPGPRTSSADTREAVRGFVSRGADLILFAGGDGTARDVVAVVGTVVPVVGIPSGVKMHSAVFAQSPEEAADLLESFEISRATREVEVMDVDEESYRRGVLQARLYALAKVPDDVKHLQSSKAVYHSGTADDEAEELGHFVAESMERGTYYILGPGSTTAAITKHLGGDKTLLGVDVVLDGEIVLKDASEESLLAILAKGFRAVVIVTPIGSQGFIFGRGNQQISARVLKQVGSQNVWVIATPTKLAGTPTLRVDTGSRELDETLRGRMRVLTGYRRKKLVPVQ